MSKAHYGLVLYADILSESLSVVSVTVTLALHLMMIAYILYLIKGKHK